MSSAQILAEAADWADTSPNARNEIFNIANGDTFRWQHMWPKIAKMFDMDYPDPIPCLHRRDEDTGAGAQLARGARTDQANAIASKPEQRKKRPATVTARKL